MEIQKIFSELGGEERLYSVLLDETELAFFSEFQKEFNSKAQKALKRKWEIMEGLKEAQKSEMGADLAAMSINQKKGGNLILGIDKPVSQDEIAVNLARDKNRYSGDTLEYTQKKLESARKFNPKATFKDIKRDYEWDSIISSMKNKKERKAYEEAVARADKKKAEILKKIKTTGKVALGTAAAVGSGILAKKIYDKKKKEKK